MIAEPILKEVTDFIKILCMKAYVQIFFGIGMIIY